MRAKKVTLKDFPIYTDGGETETCYDIECEVTPYDPGRTYGPPENCYPPEGGEVEILSIKLNGKEVPAELWEKIGLDRVHAEEIEQEAHEQLSDRFEDA